MHPLTSRTSGSRRILGVIDCWKASTLYLLVDSMNRIPANTQSWDTMEEWYVVEQQHHCCAQEALERLVWDVCGKDEHCIDPAGSLVALAAMIKVSRPEYLKKIKAIFVGNPRQAVKDSLSIAGGAAGEGYIADSATNALCTLADGYPKRIEVLVTPEVKRRSRNGEEVGTL